MRTLTLNEYQEGAMSTCMESSNNFMYMLSGLTAEVGEVNDKIAKAIRKEWIKIDNNKIVPLQGCPLDFTIELAKEISDIQWFVAGMSATIGYELNKIGNINLDKLASRKQRGVIDGNGDNR